MTHTRGRFAAIWRSALAVALLIATGAAAAAERRVPAVHPGAAAFEPNVGQWPRGVGFRLRLPGGSIVLDSNGRVVNVDGTSVHWELAGASAGARLEGSDPTGAVAHYLVGRDRTRWRTRVTPFMRVRARSVYQGVDVVYYMHNGELEFDFIIAPGARVDRIRLRFAQAPRLTATGDLALGDGRTLRAPRLYQELDGHQHHVEGRFAIAGRDVTFRTGAYDRTRPLVIDPVLSMATLVGTDLDDVSRGVGVDAAGFVYVAGYSAPSGSSAVADGFVAKLTADGSTLIATTYFGGSSDDRILDLAVDGSGAAYITGYTRSADLPVLHAIRSQYFGGSCPIVLGGIIPIPIPAPPCLDGFVAKIAPGGAELVYSTYLGGTHTDNGNSIAIDNTGAAYVGGRTLSGDFPIVGGADPNFNETGCGNEFQSLRCEEGFAVKLTPDGSAIAYSTFVGGRSIDRVNGIDVDEQGRAYLIGITNSTNLPVVAAFQPFRASGQCADNFATCYDAMVGRLSASGASFEYLTYLGGGGIEEGYGVAAGADGSTYVVGTTLSTNFPLHAAIDATLQPSSFCPGGLTSPPACSDGFVTRLSADGTALMFSTFLGGIGPEDALDVAVDPFGNVYVGGMTTSPDFPVHDAYQRALGGGLDGFVTMLTADGRAIGYSTFLGGPGRDYVQGVTLDAALNLTATGGAAAGFATLPRAARESGVGLEAFVLTLMPPWPAPLVVIDAGTGVPGLPIEDVYGTNAQLGSVVHVAVDAFGNRYVADSFNHRVYRIGANNRVTTVAGNGEAGFAGDGGDARAASLTSPSGVAVDGDGNVYIADTGNQRVRMVRAADNVIVTIAGGPGSPVTLAHPIGLAAGNGVLFIADTYNHRVLAVDATGAITTVVAVQTPTGVAIAPDGALLIASWTGHAVFRLAGGVLSTFAGTGAPGFGGDGGPATAAVLNGPFAVTADAFGRIFIADEFNHRVRMVNADGTIGTVLGEISGSLAFPVGVAADSFGDVFVADQGHHRVLRIFRSIHLAVTP